MVGVIGVAEGMAGAAAGVAAGGAAVEGVAVAGAAAGAVETVKAVSTAVELADAAAAANVAEGLLAEGSPDAGLQALADAPIGAPAISEITGSPTGAPVEGSKAAGADAGKGREGAATDTSPTGETVEGAHAENTNAAEGETNLIDPLAEEGVPPADQAAMNDYIKQQVDAYDLVNKPPVNSAELKQWLDKRVEFHQKTAVDAHVNSDLGKWASKKENQEPANKGSDAHKAWEGRKNAEEARLRKGHEAKFDKTKATELKGKEGLSPAEIQQKIRLLKFYQRQSVNYGILISELPKHKGRETELADAISNKKIVDAHIDILRSELEMDAVVSTSLTKKLLIAAALAAVAGGTMIATAAKPSEAA